MSDDKKDTFNPFGMPDIGGLDAMGSLYQQAINNFMKDYMGDIKEIAKAEAMIMSLPATRDLYAMYTMTSRLIDLVSRYEEFSDEEVETLRNIGKKICDIIINKVKKSNVDIDVDALEKVVNKSMFE